jgi:SAM-dependent methyltransferase
MTKYKTKNEAVYEGRDLEAMFFARNYHRWIIDQFRPFIGKIAAEVGGGSGNFSEILLETGLISELTIIEPSTEMYQRLKIKMANHRDVKTVQAFLADTAHRYHEYFDTLFYVNVLEHVENDEKELRLIRGCLRSGGYLCLFVPALSWLYSDFDRDIGHFRRYHKSALKDLLQNNGFELAELKYMDMAGVFGWYVFYRLLGKKMKAGEVKFYDKYFVPVMKTAEKLITPPFGKNLLAIARKK